MTVLAVFRSRAHSLNYAERLQTYGVPAVTVPTPKEARIGCGLCVRFDARYFPRAQAILKRLYQPRQDVIFFHSSRTCPLQISFTLNFSKKSGKEIAQHSGW